MENTLNSLPIELGFNLKETAPEEMSALLYKVNYNEYFLFKMYFRMVTGFLLNQDIVYSYDVMDDGVRYIIRLAIETKAVGYTLLIHEWEA